MKIIAVCGSGLGSSLILSININKALTHLGIEAEVEHDNFSSVAPRDADLFVMSRDLGKDTILQPCILLDKITDMSEIQAKLAAFLQDTGSAAQ